MDKGLAMAHAAAKKKQKINKSNNSASEDNDGDATVEDTTIDYTVPENYSIQ
jgi:hypothetical protein